MAAVTGTVQGYYPGWLVCVTGGRCLPVSSGGKRIIVQFWLVYSLTVHRFMATAVWTGMAFGPTHRWYIDSWLLQMAVTGRYHLIKTPVCRLVAADYYLKGVMTCTHMVLSDEDV